MIVASPADFRAAARRRLPRFLFDYLDGGAFGEVTMARNEADLQQVLLRQRVLCDASDIDLSTKLFGDPQALPIALGPVGIAGMFRRRGEVQAARAAAAAGIPFTLSTVSLCSAAEVAGAAPGSLWFQLYVARDRGFMRELIAQAKAAGARVLVFTVDLPVPGPRYRDRRSGMSGDHAGRRRLLQALTHPAWAWDVGVRGRPHRLGNMAPVIGRQAGLGDYIGWLARNFDPSVTWADLDWIRAAWDGPLVIKGILDREDALAAAAFGAAGLVVSNHGGRQLDGVSSTVAALPSIVDAVGDRMTVLVDGGVRSGLDILRMLALGAEGVLLGRLWVYALAAAGEAGVARLLAMLEAELRVAMALAGINSLASADRRTLV